MHTPQEKKAPETLEEFRKENEWLKQQIQAKDTELNSTLRLLSAGESVAMIVHEVLNPLTSVIARLQNLLDEESDFQLLCLILKDWLKDFKQKGVEGLVDSFRAKIEENGITILEEDLGNLSRGVDMASNSLDFMHTHLKRAVLIINSLRELSRVESQVDSIDVKQPIAMTKELMLHSLEKRNIRLVTEFKHHSLIAVDENELVQVLHNLARNALQAINKKEGCITIRTQETEDRLEIRVEDTGPGIPKDIVGRIFESRFTTKGKHEGTGLGLTFSLKLMEKYKGKVELESPGGDGKGATFLCWFPLKQD